MPYVKDADFALVTELTQLIKELAEKANHPSIPQIAGRVLRVMTNYEGRAESHGSLHHSQTRKESGIKD